MTYKNGLNEVVGTNTYSYDANGNILTKMENDITSTFTYDEANRLVSTSENGQSFTYDMAGNRKTMDTTKSPITEEDVEYVYDVYDRLVKVIKNGETICTNSYNGNGQLIQKTENGETTRYYYIGQNIIAEGSVASNGSSTLKARYLRSGTKLNSREDTTGKIGYYLQNGHGEVISLIGQAGNVLASYTYDIWGNAQTTNESDMMDHCYESTKMQVATLSEHCRIVKVSCGIDEDHGRH